MGVPAEWTTEGFRECSHPILSDTGTVHCPQRYTRYGSRVTYLLPRVALTLSKVTRAMCLMMDT